MPPKIMGATEAASDLSRFARKSPKAMERALYKFGNEVMDESIPLVPVEEGTLRDSHMVDEPEWTGDTLGMEIGYGGAAEDYARAVHEDLEAFHDDGQAKFLEQPLNRSEPEMDSRVGADFERFAGLD